MSRNPYFSHLPTRRNRQDLAHALDQLPKILEAATASSPLLATYSLPELPASVAMASSNPCLQASSYSSSPSPLSASPSLSSSSSSSTSSTSSTTTASISASTSTSVSSTSITPASSLSSSPSSVKTSPRFRERFLLDLTSECPQYHHQSRSGPRPSLRSVDPRGGHQNFPSAVIGPLATATGPRDGDRLCPKPGPYNDENRTTNNSYSSGLMTSTVPTTTANTAPASVAAATHPSPYPLHFSTKARAMTFLIEVLQSLQREPCDCDLLKGCSCGEDGIEDHEGRSPCYVCGEWFLDRREIGDPSSSGQSRAWHEQGSLRHQVAESRVRKWLELVYRPPLTPATTPEQETIRQFGSGVSSIPGGVAPTTAGRMPLKSIVTSPTTTSSAVFCSSPVSPRSPGQDWNCPSMEKPLAKNNDVKQNGPHLPECPGGGVVWGESCSRGFPDPRRMETTTVVGRQWTFHDIEFEARLKSRSRQSSSSSLPPWSSWSSSPSASPLPSPAHLYSYPQQPSPCGYSPAMEQQQRRTRSGSSPLFSPRMRPGQDVVSPIVAPGPASSRQSMVGSSQGMMPLSPPAQREIVYGGSNSTMSSGCALVATGPNNRVDPDSIRTTLHVTDQDGPSPWSSSPSSYAAYGVRARSSSLSPIAYQSSNESRETSLSYASVSPGMEETTESGQWSSRSSSSFSSRTRARTTSATTPAMMGLSSSNGCIAIPQEILDPNYKSPTFRIKNWSPPTTSGLSSNTTTTTANAKTSPSLAVTPVSSSQQGPLESSGHDSNGSDVANSVEPLSFRFNFTSQRFQAAVQASLDKSRTTTSSKNRGADLEPPLRNSMAVDPAPPANSSINNKTRGLDVQKSADCPELRLPKNEDPVLPLTRIVHKDNKVIEDRECSSAVHLQDSCETTPATTTAVAAAEAAAEAKVECRIKDELGTTAKDDKLVFRGQSPCPNTLSVGPKKPPVVEVKEPQTTLVSKESTRVEKTLRPVSSDVQIKEPLLTKPSSRDTIDNAAVSKSTRPTTTTATSCSTESLSSTSSSPSFSKGDIQKSAPVSPLSQSTTTTTDTTLGPLSPPRPTTRLPVTTTPTMTSTISSASSPLYKALSCSALESATMTTTRSTTGTPVSIHSLFLSVPGTKTVPSSPQVQAGLGPLTSPRSLPWESNPSGPVIETSLTGLGLELEPGLSTTLGGTGTGTGTGGPSGGSNGSMMARVSWKSLHRLVSKMSNSKGNESKMPVVLSRPSIMQLEAS